MPTVFDLVERELGAPVAERENPLGVTSVGVSATTVLEANPRRLALLVINLSTNAMYVRPGGVPSSSSGIRLAPNGGQLFSGWRDDLTMPSQEWRVVADGASSAIYVIEWVTYA